MGAQAIRRGQNTTVNSARPNANLAELWNPLLSTGTRRVFLMMPVPQVLGRVIVSATLSPRVKGTWPNQTLTVAPVAERWSIDQVTWDNQPDVRDLTTTLATGTLADGDRPEIDMTALVQQIANGQPHYGWRIVTNATGPHALYGFKNADAWVLTVETSDAPLEPTVLEPDGGVISVAKWVCRTDFTDLGGSTDMAAIQVQVDPDKTAPYAFDTGEVATTVPELDLADTAYAGLADGGTTSWRVRVKDSDGYWSLWSDWATITRDAKPTLTLDAPSGGQLFDPTSTVQASIDSGTIKAWSLMVTHGTDRTKIRYATGRRPGSGDELAHALPVRNNDGTVIFRDDHAYQFRVRVWDRLDRIQGSPGDPPYLEVWETVEFDDDGALVAPTSLVASTPVGSPYVTLAWKRPGTADGWVIYRGDKLIARLDDSDVDVSAGTYTWVDRGAVPNESQTWKVKAVTGAKMGLGRTVTYAPTVEGIWLLTEFGDVVLDGLPDQLSTKDKRATYRLPGRPDDVDIIGALEGISGPVTGTIGFTQGRTTEGHVDADRAILRRLRNNPTSVVQLVYGTTSVPVRLRGLSVAVSRDFTPSGNRLHEVTFECWQVGDFD